MALREGLKHNPRNSTADSELKKHRILIYRRSVVIAARSLCGERRAPCLDRASCCAKKSCFPNVIPRHFPCVSLPRAFGILETYDDCAGVLGVCIILILLGFLMSSCRGPCSSFLKLLVPKVYSMRTCDIWYSMQQAV